MNKQQSTSAAKSVESARHSMDQKSEAARKAFNDAAKNAQPKQTPQQQGEGSKQVQSQQPKPQLNMKGTAAADVNRQVHQQQMKADHQAAKARNDRAQRILDAARKNQQGNTNGLSNTFNNKAGKGPRR